MHTDTEHQRAVVFDIQRGAMTDGPGLRTTIFLKGCPLRCPWCHNPESQRRTPQTVRTVRGEEKTYGRIMTVDEVLCIVERDRAYYEASGGGLTISGGEPMYNFPFTLELARRTRAAGISVALDTSGFGSRNQWATLRPHLDLVLFDYKVTDPEQHREWTGHPRQPILDNLGYLLDEGVSVLLRCPIIPGYNDHEAHFDAIRELARHPGVLQVELMPYHETGCYKYDELHMPYALSDIRAPSAAEIDAWNNKLKDLPFARTIIHKQTRMQDNSEKKI